MKPTWAPARSSEQLIQDSRALFEKSFLADATPGVWAAPGRVNLIGDHVDYAGGISVPFALPHRTAVALAPRSDGIIRLASALPDGQVATTEIPLAEVGPGNPATWAGYAVGAVWAGLANGAIPACSGFDAAIISDVPVGSGLSSSAALECSVAMGAYGLATGEEPSEETVELMVEACIRAENEVVGASTGGLDQRSSLYGREGNVLAIDFRADTVEYVPCDVSARGCAFLVADTNAPHSLNDGQYASRRGLIDAVTEFAGAATLRDIEDAPAVARKWAESDAGREFLGADGAELAVRRVTHVVAETARTAQATEVLRAGDLAGFGQLMNDSHASLRDLYEVSTAELDCAQETALAAGALGARMTGGGFGGSIIALVEEDKLEPTAQAIADAAAGRGFPEPTFLAVTPAQGAMRLA